ncbi:MULTISPECIES: LicD family protein [Pseudomonas]|uniref:LicD family protein n=1 Tax=Pseudomonas kurunegalensis TaxID=485880 RepID=A0ACC5UQX2_9PSED|nr:MULTISPECIES: LicD family protein [Pseudomonas]MBV4516795.1 LicD family protein [Pseudomonas kurunegalensis]MBZ3662330.1 LicD family protein [Pseudomonas monteilii]MBZ3667656.1 LicD family protein [Pseudomonas monteilii]
MHDLEGKKLVLFGAGKSGGCLIEQNPGLNILAVADNDQAKQGGEFHGIPVISPEQIGETRCDVVVIASVWSKGILEQLDALGLSAIPTVIPGKREMKGMRDAHPFSHPPTKDVAREMSLTLRSLAEEGGIDLYLDFGTLLGAFRERDFIPWDDDIDFSVNDEQFDAFIALVRENKGRFPQRDGIQWGVELMSTGELGATVRATCRNLPGSFSVVPFEVDISRRVCREGMAVALGSMPEFFCPERHFDGYEHIELFGQNFKVPSDALGYLDFVYGQWRTPRQDFTFAEYPSAEVEFGQYKISHTSL